MIPPDLKIQSPAVAQYIEGWMRSYATSSGQKGFVVGISGGIDSALTAALAARTGLELLMVQMPIRQAASEHNRGLELIELLQSRHAKARSVSVDLNASFDQLLQAVRPLGMEKNELLAAANMRARLRMSTLYYLAATHGLLVAGTGNKVEDFGVGFYTKYGDGGVDLSPIADLMKTEVRAMAEALELPRSIVEAAPTDGLWGDGRTDEDQLGARYPELEEAMRRHESGLGEDGLEGRALEVFRLYLSLNKANAHKMNPIPVCLIPPSVRWGLQN